MQIIIYRGKHSNQYYLADTPIRELLVYRLLFEQFDADDFYIELKEPTETEPVCEACTKGLHRLCESDDCPCVEDKCKKKSVRTVHNTTQRKLYQAAKAGDFQAAKKLIQIRNNDGYEYEDVYYDSIEDPMASFMPDEIEKFTKAITTK